MGLYPPCFAATTLVILDAAGIAIVQEDEGWFIKSYQQIAGPYATPEGALEASMAWLSERNTRHVGGNDATYHD
jgi:hypothetical protein